MLKVRPSFIPAVIWLVISTILFLLPGQAFPKENWLSKIWFDKWVHIAIFFILVLCWNWASLRLDLTNEKRRRFFMWTAIICLGYGVGIELIQRYFIVNRSFDAGDIIADAGGCFLGWIFSSGRYIKK